MQILKKRFIWGAIFVVIVAAFVFLLMFLADQKNTPRSYMIISEEEIGNPDSVSVWCGLMVDPVILDEEQAGRVVELALKAEPAKIGLPDSRYQTRHSEYDIIICRGKAQYWLSFYDDEINATQTDPWILVKKYIYETDETGNEISKKDWSCYFSMPMEDYSELYELGLPYAQEGREAYSRELDERNNTQEG